MSIPTKEEALDIAKRYIDCAFQNKGELPRHSIPANPDRDDDIRLIEFIQNAIQPPARQDGETKSNTPIMDAAMGWHDRRDLLSQIGMLEMQLSAKQAELDSLKAAQGWRPIESAPKDGTRLLLFYSGNPHNPTKSQFIDVGFYSQWADDAWDGWWELETGGNRIFPTHWMSLPTPPVERSVDGE